MEKCFKIIVEFPTAWMVGAGVEITQSSVGPRPILGTDRYYCTYNATMYYTPLKFGVRCPEFALLTVRAQ